MMFVLKGEVGCKKNANKFNSRTRRVYKNAHFQSWHENAAFQLKLQAIPAIPVKRFEAVFRLYHGTRRRIDSDNQVTSLLDLFQDVGIIEDDCWMCCGHKDITDIYRKGDPGAEIEIYPLTDSEKLSRL